MVEKSSANFNKNKNLKKFFFGFFDKYFKNFEEFFGKI